MTSTPHLLPRVETTPLPLTAHTSRPWRIHTLAPDFRVEDVWTLPTPGGPEDFSRLVELMTTGGDDRDFPVAFRLLFALRWKLGDLLGLDQEETGVGGRVPSLRERLPDDLRALPRPPDHPTLPFRTVYLTDREFVAEIANRTVHGLMHLGWVEDGAGGYHGQMAVLNKPNGLLGEAYMALIKPFRYLVVYPALLRTIGRQWHAGPDARTGLPPGQRAVPGFPRFGKDVSGPPPAVPEDPAIDLTGSALAERVTVPLPELEELGAVERVEDFHCVAGWSALGVRWHGVPFAAFYRALVEPRLLPGRTVTHLRFRGSDGWTSTVLLEDALADDVLLATGLDGGPLTPDHGAPLRLVSPSQYGYVNVKHLCGIEVHDAKPRPDHPFDILTRSHARARVWEEERHAWVPGPMIRAPYRAVVRVLAPQLARSMRGGEDR